MGIADRQPSAFRAGGVPRLQLAVLANGDVIASHSAPLGRMAIPSAGGNSLHLLRHANRREKRIVDTENGRAGGERSVGAACASIWPHNAWSLGMRHGGSVALDDPHDRAVNADTLRFVSVRSDGDSRQLSKSVLVRI